MNIPTELYVEAIKRFPPSGQHILANQDTDSIIFYQAYNHSIADFAIKNQFLGGANFSYNRMSWIKPNFLWMMYRCGWAETENQERVLALRIKKTDFETILSQAVFSTFKSKYYDSQEYWKKELDAKEVRLQWDPDHDPFGKKLERRAIQLGLKGKMLENSGTQLINKIEDITDFVKQQKQYLHANQLDQLLVPVEIGYTATDASLNERIGIDNPSSN